MLDLTAHDLAILEAQDARTFAEWYCVLNSWGWPSALPNPEAPTHDVGPSRRGAIMGWISDRVDQKIISRVWNKDMTDEEHENFWRATSEGDELARKIHDEYIERIVAARKQYPPAKAGGSQPI